MASIIKPSSGDSVPSNVLIEIRYDFTSATTVTRFVATDHDSGTLLNGSGTHTSGVTTTSTGLQRVAIKDGTTVLDFQDNVKIGGAGPGTDEIPVSITSAPQERTGTGDVVVLVQGKCDPRTLPEYPFVVCVLYSINPVNGQRTPVTIGAAEPAGEQKKWQVTLKFKPRPQRVYVARAFLVDYSNPFTIVGATTESL
jgi:hypothetical protein